MKAFPFSLDGVAKDWQYLQLVLFNTWGDMKHMFLEKFFQEIFFPASRTATIKKEICGIRKHSRETLHEYWERFNKLCAICPHHRKLIQYLYEGLAMMDQRRIYAASGGALMDKTPAVEEPANLEWQSSESEIQGWTFHLASFPRKSIVLPLVRGDIPLGVPDIIRSESVDARLGDLSAEAGLSLRRPLAK
ncbi:hypothetical protein CR513_19452, partial [Mucuna pruriens]